MRKYIFFCCAAFFWLAGTGHAMQVVDRIVAVVNGEIVTYQDLLRQTRQTTGVESGPVVEQAMPQVLDAMIDEAVLRQEAERLEVKVTDAEVDGEIRQLKARRRLTEEDFTQGLRLQGLTLELFIRMHPH